MLSTVVAAIVSFLVVKWMLRYVQNHTFNSFGLYRIAMGVAIFGYLFTHPVKSSVPPSTSLPRNQPSVEGFGEEHSLRGVALHH